MLYRIDINSRGVSTEGLPTELAKKVEALKAKIPNADENQIEALELGKAPGFKDKPISGLFLYTEKGWEISGKEISELIPKEQLRVQILPENTPTVYRDDYQVMIDWGFFQKKK